MGSDTRRTVTPVALGFQDKSVHLKDKTQYLKRGGRLNLDQIYDFETDNTKSMMSLLANSSEKDQMEQAPDLVRKSEDSGCDKPGVIVA